ncbi:hypothetical protein M1D53_29470 (plasmid) [Bacillus sp. PK9-021]
MTILYYSKVNINSNIFSVYDKQTSIAEIMNKVYTKLDDKKEFVKKDVNTFTDKDTGELKTIESEEIYNFSELIKFKDVDEMYIMGKLIRRYPIHSESFDNKTRKSIPVVHANNATSIPFYFDLNSEIITFHVRNKFGYKQFNEGFQSLLDEFIYDVGFEIFLINDPFKVYERLEMLQKVRKIRATIIPPNANEEALEDLFNRETSDMKQSNITKKTSIFETNRKNDKGINIKSKMVKQTLDVSKIYIERGYGKLEVEGETADGTEFRYFSDKDSCYNTSIKEEDKDNLSKLKEAAKRGISSLLSKITREKLNHNSFITGKDNLKFMNGEKDE